MPCALLGLAPGNSLFLLILTLIIVFPQRGDEENDDALHKIHLMRCCNLELADKVLGEGYYSVVRLGKETRGEKRDVAIKIVDKSRYDLRRDWPSMWENEQRILRRMDHPNIVRLYDVVDNPAGHQRWYYLVMEYVDGKEPYELLEEGKGGEEWARRLFKQIGSAVEYMHGEEIAHLDLKLDNMLVVNKKEQVKLVDFGISTHSPGDDATFSTRLGTPSYMAPEVLRGQRYIGRKADMWSAGVVLYTLATGDYPFGVDIHQQPHPNPIKDAVKVLRDIERYRESSAGLFARSHPISPGLLRVLGMMLQVDPTRRKIMTEVLNDRFSIKIELGNTKFSWFKQPSSEAEES